MRVIWLIMLFLLGIARVNADTLYIAAASNLVYCLEALNTQFTQQNPQLNLKVVTGSSGNLFSQIQQNAPFEVFLSADVLHPQQLVQQQQADANSLAIYSKGQIALWTNNPTIDLKKGLSVLLQPNIKRIAIANPQHAPYGQAAQAALQKQQLWQPIQSKLVLGENISQTLQFVQTGNAEVGVVALSLLRAPALAGQGQYWLIPQHLYPPLEQAMVVTKRGQANPWAYRYLQFLQSPSAQAIFSDYGFLLPAKST
ncbi:MAG: molybdate ABC transporter substrate-binding protein [Agitococcus sp.]|nr:molybdate ABC transporter substrate-binding protein [Agitococcus sp.]